MKLMNLLKNRAASQGLIHPQDPLDLQTIFQLVRDIPYRRASDRRPESIISEWQGTCSGKHYLLQALYSELGFFSQVMAGLVILPVQPEQIHPEVWDLYERANRRFVDIHNYLILHLPNGDRMIVDATWPLSAQKEGRISNETFIPGQDQELALTPLKSWAVPDGRDPQEFKDELLKTHFSPAELEFRELIIASISS